MNCDIYKIIKNGTSKELKDCIDAGANVNIIKENGWTPLHYAVRYGYTDKIRILLEAGANVKDDYDSLYLAASWNHPEIVRMLLEAGANVNVTDDNDGWTLLHYVAWAGYIKIVHVLLEAGADITAKDNRGRIPRDLTRKPEIIQLLEPRQSKKAGFLAIGKRSKRNKRSNRKKY